MIDVRALTKRYGRTTAVSDLTFTVASATVTGFLGPNGAGKSTTMRMIVGLDAPTSGVATISGRRYVDSSAPMREVGALLDATAVHPRRTAYHHLLCLARSNGIPRRRVSEVLGIVGLDHVAGRPAGQFSLGMSQRLGIATALLGDPPVLIFDEPVNGLDPEGIRWIRALMAGFAGEGRTVLVSSHLMSEMAVTAHHLIVIGRGRLIADAPTEQILTANTTNRVLVRTSHTEALTTRLCQAGAAVRPGPVGALLVTGLDATRIGGLAAADGLALSELTPLGTSLEEAFMNLTAGSVEYSAGDGEHP